MSHATMEITLHAGLEALRRAGWCNRGRSTRPFAEPQGRRVHAAAFSLIELLLVLVILAVLAALVVPKFTNRTEQARTTAAKTDIANIETALDAFEIDTGRYPSTEEGLKALLAAPPAIQDWRGPYIKRGVPNDPWGNPYNYRYPGRNNTAGFDLYTLGADGREGNDDIGNWAVETR